jgi:hypothetical protein
LPSAMSDEAAKIALRWAALKDLAQLDQELGLT